MTVAFFLVAALLVLSAVGVIAFANPIYSALSLVSNLFLVAVVFAMLDAHFLATVQIIVYAGAIMVLVLFVLMLLNMKLEAPGRLSKFFLLPVLAVALCFAVVLIPPLSQVFQGFGAAAVAPEGTVEVIGKVLYTDYVFPFEAASILITAAIVGSVMIAKRPQRGK